MPDQIDRILRINTVLDRTGLSRATLYRKIADGNFPAQERLSARCVGWRESEVRRWVYNPYGYVAANDNGRPVTEAAHGEG